MKTFLNERRRSAGYARDRMKLLLISERIECSPQMMKMLRNDMIHTVKKYLTIDEEQVKIQITQEPAVLHAYIPVLNKKDNRLVSSQLQFINKQRQCFFPVSYDSIICIIKNRSPGIRINSDYFF